MSRFDEMMRIVTAVHEAGLDVEAWSGALALVSRLLDCTGLVVATDDRRRGFTHSFEAETPPGARDAYLEEFHAIDPVIAFVRRAPAGRAYCDQMAIERSALRRSRFHADFATRFGYEQCVQAFTHRSEAASGFLVGARPRAKAPFDEVDRSMLDHLLPHIEQAMRVGALLRRARLAEGSALAALDRVAEGVIWVDGGSRIRFANAAAREMLRDGTGLRAVGTRLAAALAADRAKLDRALQGALDPSPDRPPTAFSVRRPPPSRPLLVRVAAVHARAAERLHDLAAGAVVLVGDPDAGRRDPDVVGTTLGLTGAEAEIASLLAAGDGLDEIMVRLGVKESTVRTHLRHAFEKTGTGRQSHLVALVNAIPSAADPGRGRRARDA